LRTITSDLTVTRGRKVVGLKESGHGPETMAASYSESAKQVVL